MFHRVLRQSIFALAVASMPLAAFAQSATPSFTDLPETHPAFQAAEYLKANGILQGYSDGTFRPDASVKRAEALKVIAAPIVSAEQLAQFTTTVYTDIPAGEWYIPYVEAGRQILGIIDGPPKTSVFNGVLPVKKVEFFKMLLLANKIDPAASYSEIQLPLANDVTDPGEWYYPYLRYSIASSLTLSDTNGNLNPAKELTRGEVAIFLHRYLMYKEGRRTQALLSAAESDIVNTLQFIEAQQFDKAEFASARALLASRGALTSRPDEPIVKGAVKTAEGFRALLLGYQAGVRGELQQVIEYAGTAWNLAESAKQFSPSLETVATQMQTIAKGMADEARRLSGTPAQ